ncbi:MAG TPA: hypothetical protein VNT75_11660 [Symbiobacteriaceae bacterium]|nr:hypothetical protein [Symbiobacteriaceae bacterium]
MVLSPADEARLDSLARSFQTAFQNRFADVEYLEEFMDQLIVTIPAKHPETGDVVVWLDADEITVGIGPHFHRHFEAYLQQGMTTEEQEREAVEGALDFIEEFIAEKTFLRIFRTDIGDPAGASVLRADAPGQTSTMINAGVRGDWTAQDYVWSGPRAAQPGNS